MTLEELDKKIDDNYAKITENMNKLHSHEKKIERNKKQIKQNTSALEILHTIKETSWHTTNKFFIMWLITFIFLLVSFGYIVYLHNDISKVIDQEIEQETTKGSNYYVGGDVNG